MKESQKPPFRADHVGSLLRPRALLEAREKAQKGEITQAQLKAVEDRAIRDVVALQEATGIEAVTDGEFRRTMWHTDFLTGIDGIESIKTSYAVAFKGEQGETSSTSSMLGVTRKLSRPKPIMLDHFSFLKSVTRKTAKFCIPSATYVHLRGGAKTVPPSIYPDQAEFWADLARCYQEEIADLAAAGCTYLQLDDVSFAFLCDATIREQIKRDGEDPARLPALYANAINAFIAKRPPGMGVTIHTCRGNHRSMWMAEGGYDAIAETVFGTIDVDGFFLEFDSARSGGFEPLRFVPKTKRVVLGLVSTKTKRIETKDELKRRIEEASKYVPLENLCLSPQCGFASTALGNEVTEEIERRKLELIVEVAQEVWGST